MSDALVYKNQIQELLFMDFINLIAALMFFGVVKNFQAFRIEQVQ